MWWDVGGGGCNDGGVPDIKNLRVDGRSYLSFLFFYDAGGWVRVSGRPLAFDGNPTTGRRNVWMARVSRSSTFLTSKGVSCRADLGFV
jgi:hypothetical protein